MPVTNEFAKVEPGSCGIEICGVPIPPVDVTAAGLANPGV